MIEEPSWSQLKTRRLSWHHLQERTVAALLSADQGPLLSRWQAARRTFYACARDLSENLRQQEGGIPDPSVVARGRALARSAEVLLRQLERVDAEIEAVLGVTTIQP